MLAGLLIGTTLGVVIGLFVAALCVAARDGDATPTPPHPGGTPTPHRSDR